MFSQYGKQYAFLQLSLFWLSNDLEMFCFETQLGNREHCRIICNNSDRATLEDLLTPNYFRAWSSQDPSTGVEFGRATKENLCVISKYNDLSVLKSSSKSPNKQETIWKCVFHNCKTPLITGSVIFSQWKS